MNHHLDVSTVSGPLDQTLLPDDGSDIKRLLARIEDLEQQVASLREGLSTRQQIGFITGVLAHQHDLQPDQAWDLLTRTSQELNVKVRRVSQVLMAAYSGHLDPSDVALAVHLSAFLSTTATATASQRGRNA